MWCVMYTMVGSSMLNKCLVALFRGSVVPVPV